MFSSVQFKHLLHRTPCTTWPYLPWLSIPVLHLMFSSSCILHSSIPLAFQSSIHLFLTFLNISDEGAFLSITLMWTCHLINTMHWLLDEGMEGGLRGGFFLFPSQKILIQLGSSMSAWGPKLFVRLFLSLYSAFLVKTGTQQNKNKSPQGKGGGGGVGRCRQGRFFPTVVWIE